MCPLKHDRAEQGGSNKCEFKRRVPNNFNPHEQRILAYFRFCPFLNLHYLVKNCSYQKFFNRMTIKNL